MKIALPFLLLFCIISNVLSAHNNWKDRNILIVYLSRTNNTKAVAEMIESTVRGDLVRLELQNPYPENYDEIVAQVAHENETGFLPPLKAKITNFDKYDVVFVGFPTWGMQLPPPVKSFLSANDLNEKIVIPFNTNAGYGLGSSIKTIEKFCPQSKILRAFSVKGGIERDGILFVMKGEKEEQVSIQIQEWLNSLSL